ncbi:YafY family protein [Rhodococcus sp. HNM0569]|uniref:helix-turn-helix transcriptional regulator n=1 Tax=Rhodococcus sp. HNM0569 TaxID=2716340 RepID=UPI001469E9C5|nr:YafY family protein [Rhodococcus sp. HNM0569]NLU84893.1 YafY family transcriptional regulator [Rhodococcus sp. HNM0569]
MSSNRLSARLSRLLNLVPYFIANPGISAAEAADELGVSVPQLMTDLNQLWVCGLPGYGPGDLIDLSFSEDSIEVTFSAGIDRPLRLTSTEATALLVALRSLVDMPGTADPTAVESAMAKIEAAAGEAAAARLGTVAPSGDGIRAEDPVAATVRSALQHRHALRITYFSASRDTVSDRVVDPLQLVAVENRSYLHAWCRSADGVRLFRLDRIDAATELDEPVAAPDRALASRAHLELVTGTESHEPFGDPALPRATLRVTKAAMWAVDYYPMDILAVDPDGSVRVTMPFASPEWMARLLLGFGADVTVLDPPDLAAAVRRGAEQALALYDDSDSTV